MKPKGPSPHSQGPATCPYSAHVPIPPPEDASQCYLPIYAWVFQMIFSLSGLPIKTLNALLLAPLHATCSAYLNPLNLITRITTGEQYRSLSSSLRSFPHSPVISPPLRTNILLSTLFCNIYSLFPPSTPATTFYTHTVYISAVCNVSIPNCFRTVRTGRSLHMFLMRGVNCLQILESRMNFNGEIINTCGCRGVSLVCFVTACPIGAASVRMSLASTWQRKGDKCIRIFLSDFESCGRKTLSETHVV